MTASTRTETVRARFAEAYREYQYHLVEFVSDHLADVSRAFDGDLQEALVLAIIGQVTLKVTAPPLPDGPIDLPAISASRIADVTGIPRQTVRRKLASLERRGWIERTEAATYKLVVTAGEAPAHRDLAGLDERAIDRTARLHVNLERIAAGRPSSGD